MEINQIESLNELIVTEYTGELIISLDDIYDKLTFNKIAKAYVIFRNELKTEGKISDENKASLEYKYIMDQLTMYEEKYIDPLSYMMDPTNDVNKFANRHLKKKCDLKREDCLLNRVQKLKDEIVLTYLVRGRVTATYDLNTTYLTCHEKKDSIDLSYEKKDKIDLSLCLTKEDAVLKINVPDYGLTISPKINPWFVYPTSNDDDSGIVGYEVLEAEEVNSDFELIQEVRCYAERALERKAKKRELEDKAISSLEETLKAFYSSTTGMPTENVIFEYEKTGYSEREEDCYVKHPKER